MLAVGGGRIDEKKKLISLRDTLFADCSVVPLFRVIGGGKGDEDGQNHRKGRINCAIYRRHYPESHRSSRVIGNALYGGTFGEAQGFLLTGNEHAYA